MSPFAKKKPETPIDATEYLLRINDSVEHSIRNISSMCPEVAYESMHNLKSKNKQFKVEEARGLVDGYDLYGQAHHCKELQLLAIDPNLLITLRAKLVSFVSDDQRCTFQIMINEQIARIVKLREIIEKWVYYTEEFRGMHKENAPLIERLSGPPRPFPYIDPEEEVTPIIWKIIALRIDLYLLQRYLHRVLPTPEQRVIADHPNRDGSNFNGMLFIDIKEYFIQASNRKNKQGGVILTEEEVIQFINRAFFNKGIDLPKIKANYGKNGRLNFVRLFFEYYEKCTTGKQPIDERPAIRDEYIKLLTNNFEGFPFKETKVNFSNSKNRGLSWKLQ